MLEYIDLLATMDPRFPCARSISRKMAKYRFRNIR